MLKVVLHTPLWFGTSDDSNTGMCGVFQGHDGHSHIWRHQWLAYTPDHLVLFQNLTGDRKIKNIEFATHYALLHLVAHK